MLNGTFNHLRDLMGRGQGLVDTPRPADGHPPEWHVQAWLIGDLPAMAAAVAREPTTTA